MKKLLLSIFVISLVSCQNPKEQKPEEAPNEKAIGSALMDGTSEMTPIIPGEVSNQTIWLDYIQAHNDSCLLYTSPSPRDYAASRMPSSA